MFHVDSKTRNSLGSSEIHSGNQKWFSTTNKRINVVSPGIIDTPMVLLKGKKRKDLYRNLTKDNLISRPGKSEEVASAIIFAIENEFITGTTIDIDGGWLSA